MKEKITQYLSSSTKRKKVIWSMKNESWYPDLEAEYENLGIPAEWGAQRKLWHYWHGTSEVPKCPITGKERKWRSGECVESLDLPHFSQGYSTTASRHAAGKFSAQKSEATLKERYGVSNAMYIDGIKEKREKIFLEKYGVSNPSSNEKVKQKRIQTMLERYGVEHNFINCQEKMEEKYGVRNPAHVPEIAEKICNNRFKKRHKYVLDSGKTIYLQGYEPYGLDYLKKKYKESDILYYKKHMPEIWYVFEDKEHKYYPDFFVPVDNLVIEIKSPYTFSCDREQIQEKIRATNNAGHNLLLLVFQKNGQLELEQEYKLRR